MSDVLEKRIGIEQTGMRVAWGMLVIFQCFWLARVHFVKFICERTSSFIVKYMFAVFCIMSHFSRKVTFKESYVES